MKPHTVPMQHEPHLSAELADGVMKTLRQWELPNNSKVELPDGHIVTFLKMDGMYAKWDDDGNLATGNFSSGFIKTETGYKVQEAQYEPQLSAEMEKRFDEEFIGKSENYPSWCCGGDQCTGHAGEVRDIKHFLATALEEQRLNYVRRVEEYFGHIENDGVTGEPMVVTREEIEKDIVYLLTQKKED